MDPRIQTLAHNLIHYSTQLQPGENILIEMFDQALPLSKALVEEAYRVGAHPFLSLHNSQLQRVLLKQASANQWAQAAEWECQRMSAMDAYIGIRASENISETADVPPEQMQLYQQHFIQPVHMEIRVPRTRWCVLRYPSSAMAQLANLSTEAFEDFFFQVCTLDYSKMDKAMDPLVALLNATDQVRIAGPGTDLTFSVKGLSPVKCSGRRNIPDGEVYTAPVKDSVNGVLTYNTPSVYQGVTYENIRLEFTAGKITNASANETEKLNKVLDTDAGSRFIGEFALGVNPCIHRPMKDTLFDEKICGSFHFTPGNAYKQSNNGNQSAIHWDMVCIQSPEYGGGKIWFDGRLIRQDGRFVLPELACLNPENLV